MVLPQDQISLIQRSSQRMLIGRLKTLEVLKQMPDVVRRQVAALSEDQLRRRPSDAAWSIKEVCAHLRDISEVGDQRVLMILTQSLPKLPVLKSDWVRERGAQDQSIEDILGAYRTARDRTIDQIENLADASWARTGHHPESGHLSLRQLCERLLSHERDHLEQVSDLIQVVV